MLMKTTTRQCHLLVTCFTASILEKISCTQYDSFYMWSMKGVCLSKPFVPVIFGSLIRPFLCVCLMLVSSCQVLDWDAKEETHEARLGVNVWLPFWTWRIFTDEYGDLQWRPTVLQWTCQETSWIVLDYNWTILLSFYLKIQTIFLKKKKKKKKRELFLIDEMLLMVYYEFGLS